MPSNLIGITSIIPANLNNIMAAAAAVRGHEKGVLVNRPLVLTSPTLFRAGSPRFNLPSEELLPTSQTNDLHSRYSPEVLAELRGLAEESNPELVEESLLALGHRLEQRQNFSAAAELYSLVLGAASHSTNSAAMPRLTGRAQLRLESLQGRGALGSRIELLARRLVSQAMDPVAILSFGLAGGAAGWARDATLAALGMRGASCLTRGLPASLLAGTVAYAAEVPLFMAARRGFGWMIGDSGATREAWPEELAGTALFLGALRVTGGLAAGLSQRLRLDSGGSGLVASTAILGGVYLGHRLEERVGLRVRAAEPERWLDAAETWLQLSVGNRVAAGLLSIAPLGARPDLALHWGALDLMESSASRPSPLRFETGERIFSLAAETSEEGDDGPTVPNFRWSDLAPSPLRDALGSRATSEILSRTEEIGQLLGMPEAMKRTMAGTSISSSMVLEVALQRLHHMVIHSRIGGLRGNYLNWITRRALDSMLLRTDPTHFDELLSWVYYGGSLHDYEQFLAQIFPQYRLVPPRLLHSLSAVPGYLISSHEAHRRIRALPLSLYSRDLLHRFAKFQGEVPVQSLDDLAEAVRTSPETHALVERILTFARVSPVSYLRVHRLMVLIASQFRENHYPKLQELSGVRIPLRSQGQREVYSASPETIANSADDAFVNDPDLTQLLSEFYPRLPSYLAPLQRQRRQARTQRILSETWRQPGPVNSEEMVRAFRAFGDPASLRVADSIASGRVDLQILYDDEFMRVAERFGREEDSGTLFAFFLWPERGVERDTIYIRQIRHVSNEVFPRMIFHRMSSIVHEVEHHRRHPVHPRTVSAARQEEMIAVLRSVQWRAEQGDVERLEDYLTESPGGFAMTLRDRIEASYLYFPDPEM